MRSGWNGKGQYVFYMPGYPDGIEANVATGKATGAETVRVQPYLSIMTVQGSIVPWIPSMSDVFAEDWMAIPF